MPAVTSGGFALDICLVPPAQTQGGIYEFVARLRLVARYGYTYLSHLVLNCDI